MEKAWTGRGVAALIAHLVDSHCHLDAGEFDVDRGAVIQRARAAGVVRQVVPAVNAAGWAKQRAVCRSEAGLFAAYGLHPIDVATHRQEHLGQLREWIERERPVAIGECGLDFFLSELDPTLQHHYFAAQLQLAREYDLPLIVHARHSVEAVILAIRRVGKLRGVVHSFSGSAEQAGQLWDAGFLVGLGGPVTYERANRLRRLAATMPLDRLLLESDAPDQPDMRHRGQRNEPAHVAFVASTIAALRGEDVRHVAEVTSANAERLFGLDATLSATA